MARLIKNILGILERLLFFWPVPKGVYVVNYHGTPASVMHKFKKHLEYYSRKYHILDPAGFESICKTGVYPESSKPLLLLTFDDGMQNNKQILDILQQKQIRVFFFVVPAFIDFMRPEQYLSEVIRPGYSNKNETEEEDFLPMDWDTIREARKRGHRIGSHTLSHYFVRDDNEDKARQEIAGSKRIIEEKLSEEVPYFCSVNNTGLSVGPVQDRLIREHYKYHFTTYYGHNFPVIDPMRIERINIEAYWSMNEVRFALGNIRKSLIKT